MACHCRKKVLEFTKESISIKKSFWVGWGGVGWLQPITMSAAWQNLQVIKERIDIGHDMAIYPVINIGHDMAFWPAMPLDKKLGLEQ